MSFTYRNTQLYCDALSCAALAAEHGTPLYVYSGAALDERAGSFRRAADELGGTVHLLFAVKANGNPHLLQRLARRHGFGADVTSGGELFLAQQAGIPGAQIAFSGVGKTDEELVLALDAGVKAVHVESASEFARLAALAAERRQSANVAVRVNPNIAVDTHPHISTGEKTHKFGVDAALAAELLQQAAAHPWLTPVGLALHIGSQIVDLAPYARAAALLVDLANGLAAAGVRLRTLDLGGGLGIDYQDAAPSPAGWLRTLGEPVIAAGYELVVEPGRSVVGTVGVLLTSVVYTKNQGQEQFAICDAGMNDLLRPALYNAHHPIHPVRASTAPSSPWHVVGPVCETGDTLARARALPPLQRGDVLAVTHAGAYGFSMSSNYNGRRRPAEVLVDGDQVTLIRRRQHWAALLDGCPPIRQI